MADMDCLQVEELMSLYLENEVSEELHQEITDHIEQCQVCKELKEQVEELLFVFPELEEEVPFFLKNRLHYIPESQQVIELPESRFYYMKWVAAAIGTFVLFLNLFYFTNIYPPANRFLHLTVSKLETLTVETGAFFERMKESKDFFLFSFFKGSSDDDNDNIDENGENTEQIDKQTDKEQEGSTRDKTTQNETASERKNKDEQSKTRDETDSQVNSTSSQGGKNG